MTFKWGHMTALCGHVTGKWGQLMLQPIIGSENRENVLVFLWARDEGYPRQIARFFDSELSSIQDQLDRLEAGGVIVSRMLGRTRIYQFNPEYAFLDELKALLEKAVSFYPKEKIERLTMDRRRPRRRGKPL
jgi:hypothetical protein